jgi:hypothetical protein
VEVSRLGNLFDYKTLRFLLGLIGLCLPFAVTLSSSTRLNSISAAYYTDGKYILVGALVVVGILLFAYSGHSVADSRVSKFGSAAAIVSAISRPACIGCSEDISSQIHFISSAVLFLVLAYFCLVPFQMKTRGAGGKKGRRSLIYRICGWTMLACIAGLGLANIFLSVGTINEYRLTYYGEATALIAFGIAFIVSSKMSRFIADEDELFSPFAK